MIPYAHQSIDQDDIDAVSEVLRSDWLTQGPKVREFEEAFAKFVGAKYAVATCNGTAALHASCAAWGMENLTFNTTTLTFVATANAMVMAGAKPKFMDIDQTYNVNTGTDVSVDFAGLPVDNPGIIEDACHALGAEHNGKRIGSRAPMTCFSFHPVKHITTGEGGMVTTNNPHYYDRLLSLRNHGRVDGEMVYLGHNYRMSDIQAALGLSQLKKLPRFLDRRREIALRYCQAFGMKFVEGHAYHLFVIEVDNRDEVRQRLADKGIGTQTHYKPVHLQPYYREQGWKEGDCPLAEAYWKRCISLPMYEALTNDQVDYIVGVLSDFRV